MIFRNLIYTLLAMSLSFFPSKLFGKPKHAVQRVEPMNWWIGMENSNLQILVYGANIGSTEVSLQYEGVTLEKTTRVKSPNYLFLDLIISKEASPGQFDISFKAGKKIVATYQYQLKERKAGSKNRQGFNTSDAMYLIMPDRFANGHPANDNLPGMLEKADRKAPYGRHGGDLKGILNHLDYIQELGFTALWLNPVQENNQPEASYHGYAITDYYNIDARLGTNAEFKELVTACERRGIKMIMDMVFNHCGHHHWWMKDLPMDDWLNQWGEFTRSNYRLSTVADPYASQADLNLTTKGWFDTSMPDLNLKNELLLTYLIQNSIWWVEYADLKGIRMDTYPYPDKEGMAIWAQAIMKEYPNFNIVGEAWISSAAKLCYWQKDFPNRDGFNTYLPTLMDFPLFEAIKEAFNEDEGWDRGLIRLYDVLADDHLYPHPENMVVFPENHDVGRLAFFLNNDINKMKLTLAFVSTIRGIPQMYYGSELLMDGNGFEGHANIRKDFPGGWPNDPINAFENKGRTVEQNELVDFLSTILNYRKKETVLHNGKMLHFIPQEEVYVYFRYNEEKAVMVILNNSEKDNRIIDTERFSEIIKHYSSGINIITQEKLKSLSLINSPAKSATIIELK